MMAEGVMGGLHCLQHRNFKSRVIIIKRNNFTVGKAITCDLRLNSVEIDPLLAVIVKFNNKDGWSIINHSCRDGVSSVRVNRRKVRPNCKHGLKEGDLISFGYLDGNFEYVYQKYNARKKNVVRFETDFAALEERFKQVEENLTMETQQERFEEFLVERSDSPTDGFSQYISAPSTSAISSANAGFSFGTPVNTPAASGLQFGANSSTASASFRFGTSGIYPQSVASVGSNYVNESVSTGSASSSAATGFFFGSGVSTSKTADNLGCTMEKRTALGDTCLEFETDTSSNIEEYQTPVSAASTSAGLHFPTDSIDATASNSARRADVETTSAGIHLSDKRDRNVKSQKLISAKDATIKHLRLRLKNFEKNIKELRSGQQERENHIAQSVERHCEELREKNTEIAELKAKFEKLQQSEMNFRTKLANAEKNISHNDKLQQKINRQQVFCRQKEAEMLLLKKKAENAVKEMTRCKQNYEKQKVDDFELTKSLKTLREEKDTEILKLSKRLEITGRAISDVKLANEKLHADYSESIKREQQSCRQKNAEISQLKIKLESDAIKMTAKLKEAEEKLRQMSQASDSRQRELCQKNGAEITRLKNQIENDAKRIDDMEKTEEKMRVDHAELTNRQRGRISELFKELKQTREKLQNEKADMTRRQQEISQQKNEDAKLMNSLQQLNQKYTNDIDVLAKRLQQTSQQKDVEITRLKSKAERDARLVNELQQLNEKLKGDIALLPNYHSQASQQVIDQKDLKISELRNKVDNDAKFLNSLQQQNQNLKKDISLLTNCRQEASQKKDLEINQLKSKTETDAKLMNSLQKQNRGLTNDIAVLNELQRSCQQKDLEIVQLKSNADNDAIEKIELKHLNEKLESEKVELIQSQQKRDDEKRNFELEQSLLKMKKRTLKQDYNKLQRDYENLLEFRRPMLDQQREEVISKLRNQLSTLENQRKLFEELNINFANEKSLSQQRLNKINQLKSELKQYALSRNRLNCDTCKKFRISDK